MDTRFSNVAWLIVKSLLVTVVLCVVPTAHANVDTLGPEGGNQIESTAVMMDAGEPSLTQAAPVFMPASNPPRRAAQAIQLDLVPGAKTAATAANCSSSLGANPGTAAGGLGGGSGPVLGGGGAMGPGVAAAPIHYFRGAVIEKFQDASLPGPALGFSNIRMYDSCLRKPDNSELPAYEGYRWIGAVGPFVRASSLEPDGTPAELAFYVDACSKLVFTENGGSYDSPPGYNGTLTVVGSGAAQTIEITETDTDAVYIFHGINTSVTANDRGRCQERTTKQNVTESIGGVTFNYDSYGRCDDATTCQGTTCDISYHTSGAEATRIDKVEVKDTSQNVVQKTVYTHYGIVTSPSTNIGNTGDLVQVTHSLLSSDTSTWVDRVTQYRYYRDSGTGRAHQLKAVFEPDAIERIISAGDTAVDTAAEIMQKADTYQVNGGKQLLEYASRSFTYYTSNESTASIDTPWSTSENLNSTFGGSELPEYIAGVGRVKTETINGACNSCGGASGGGIKRSYFYMELNGGSSTDESVVVLIVVEDTEDSASPRNAVSRKVIGLNSWGVPLRIAYLEDDTAGKSWCTSHILDDDHRITERRMPSAHTLIDTNSDIKSFLNPTSGTNDTATLNDSEGVIYLYEYNSDNYQTGTKVKEGENGTAYYLDYAEYGDGTTVPKHLVTERRTYDTKVSSNPGSNGIATTYSYTFHDTSTKTQIKVRTTTLPSISTSQNGSGTATTVEEYFDDEGRLRWTKDGEGYVDYYSYHPDTGGLAFEMVDVNTGSLDTEITSPSGDWLSWSGSAPFTRGPSFTALELVTEHEYDDLGRKTRTIDPDDSDHRITYQGEEVRYFPYWDATANKPELPVRVTKTNGGGQVIEQYDVDPAQAELNNGVPKLKTGTSQSNYTSWTINTYDDENGQLVAIDRYHDIPSSDTGSHSTNYHRTGFIYNDEGQRAYTVQQVSGAPNSSGVEQVTNQIYDVLGRVIEVKRGVSGSAHNLGSGTDNYDNYTGVTYKTVSQTEFDFDDVGDGHVTKAIQNHDTGTNDYTYVKYHRTYRGHLRGIEPYYLNGASPTAIGPFTVHDVDWKGRTTATAEFTSNPTWTTVVGDDDYAETISSNRVKYSDTTYDDLGRIYRTKQYAVNTSGTKGNAIQIDSYFDRNDRVVARQPKYSAGTEYAYDGAGRRYQMRTVIDLEATKYSSGAYKYRAPTPNPALSSMSGGNDQVLAFTHQAFDSAGNETETHTFELNHNDTGGLTFTGTADYVRLTAYSWYDDADRVSARGNYGSGDTATGAGEWKKTSVPSRPSTAPSASSNTVLLTKHEYNAVSGRPETITDPEGKKQKTFYDDLGRTTYVASNYVNFSPPSTGTGGSDKSQDQVVKRVYNGLDKVTTLTAMDADGDGNVSTSDDQDTTYEYADSYNASLVTKTTYPDSGSGSDVVTMTYFLDGLVKSKTDQRGVVIDYTYKAYPGGRALEWEKATTIPSPVDNAFKSIKREFDSQRRISKITCYADTTGTTVKNQIEYTYHTNVPGDRISYFYQDHDSTTSGSSRYMRHTFDTSAVSSVFSDGARLWSTRYPSAKVVNRYFDGTIADRLHRANRLNGNHSGTYTDLAEYKYNGVARLVDTEYPTPDVHSRFDEGDGDGTYEHLDRFGRIKTKDWRKSSTIKDQFNYTHDYVGNRLTRDIPTSVYSSNTLDQAYTYDGLHRLQNTEEGTLNTSTGQITTLKFEQDWALDSLGNWTTFKQDDDGNSTWDLDQDRTHNDANEITQIESSSTHVAHDAAGNMTKLPQPGSWSSHYDLIYDAWNRLVEVKDGATSIAKFEYDGLHQRTLKEDVAAGNTYHYYYNPSWQVIDVRLNSESGTKLEQNVWHPYYVDALAVRYYDSNSDGDYIDTDETEFALHDANFNITSLLNTSGTVIERYTYSAYGQLVVRDASFGVRSAGSSFANPYTYAGRRFDSETGLYHYRNRYYDSQLGRFISRDPIAYDGSQWNLFEYAGSRPLILLDPLGLEWIPGGGPGALPPGVHDLDDVKLAGGIGVFVGGLLVPFDDWVWGGRALKCCKDYLKVQKYLARIENLTSKYADLQGRITKLRGLLERLPKDSAAARGLRNELRRAKQDAETTLLKIELYEDMVKMMCGK